MNDSEYRIPEQEFRVLKLRGVGSPSSSDLQQEQLPKTISTVRTRHPLVGVGGHLRSGKDTFADFLVSNHGYLKTFMSETLNEALLRLNPVIPIVGKLPFDEESKTYTIWRRYQELHDEVGYTEAKKDPEVRRLLQVLGTEVGRDLIGEDTWVDAMKKKILEADQPVVVTGIRFPNELRMIQELGGTTVWVDRPSVDGSPVEVANHASETSVGLEDFEFVAENDGSLKDLELKAAGLAEILKED